MAMQYNRGALLTGVGLGAGLMYFLDPEKGRRRRALVRDKLVRAAHVSGDAAEATRRDLTNRASGAAALARGVLRRGPVDDQVLLERVRAQLGRAVSHPRAIDVGVAEGVVTLRGPILAWEVSRLLRAVERIRGVRDIVNALEEHESAANVPSLQGGSPPPGLRTALLHGQWSPTTRLMTGLLAAAGTGLALNAGRAFRPAARA